jgi:hypothetical protein
MRLLDNHLEGARLFSEQLTFELEVHCANHRYSADVPSNEVFGSKLLYLLIRCMLNQPHGQFSLKLRDRATNACQRSGNTFPPWKRTQAPHRRNFGGFEW